jgi:hypothetical protein
MADHSMADHSGASPAPPKNVQRGDYLVAFRTSSSVRPFAPLRLRVRARERERKVPLSLALPAMR